MNSLSDLDRTIVALSFLRGVGSTRIRKLLHELFSGQVGPARVYEFMDSFEKDERVRAVGEADSMFSRCREEDVFVVPATNRSYPKQLLSISDLPPILYVKGSIEALSMKAIAVVGTRKPSAFGLESAFRIARTIGERGLMVASGLALGIDASAHRGAIEGNGITVAVLAGGLDDVRPMENRDLSERILENRGALVAEHPLGYPTYRTEYVKRNRIQSGLSIASVIVESGKAGGSIRQAEFTHKQGRPLYVVYPERFSASNSDYDISGSLMLMDKYGARTLANKQDVIDLIGMHTAEELE